jgi:hypothetical protein
MHPEGAQFWQVQWPNPTNIKWWVEADNSGAIEASATFTVSINYTMMEGGQLYINSFGYKEKFTCQYCYKSTHLCTTARVHQSSTHHFSTLQGTDPALMSCCKIYAVALLGRSKLQARLGWLLVWGSSFYSLLNLCSIFSMLGTYGNGNSKHSYKYMSLPKKATHLNSEALLFYSHSSERAWSVSWTFFQVYIMMEASYLEESFMLPSPSPVPHS